MERKTEEKTYVGIDVSKRDLQIVRIDGGDILREWLDVKTDEAGLSKLMKWLSKTDVVGVEAGIQGFWLARQILSRVGCETIVLNPSHLAMIYSSLKKTDEEDALKLAHLIQGFSKEELPQVPLPNNAEQRGRNLVGEQSFWSRQRTIYKNRLHSIFSREGFTHILKNHLDNHKNREKHLELLENTDYHLEASRLLEHLFDVDKILGELGYEITTALQK